MSESCTQSHTQHPFLASQPKYLLIQIILSTQLRWLIVKLRISGCYMHYIYNTTQANSSTTNDPSTFLAYHGRKLDQVLEDGNCMFQSLAKQLSGDSDKHGQLRDKLCEFISLNGELLKGWVTDGLKLDEHLCSVRKPCVFGSQLELKAASTMWKMMLCSCALFVNP